MDKRLKILFTGANGYLGEYFINYFRDSEYEINTFTRNHYNMILELHKKNKLDFNNSKLFLNKCWLLYFHF